MLTSEQKAEIKKDFLELTGGLTPDEAEDQVEEYVEEHGGQHSEEDLHSFFEEWAKEAAAVPKPDRFVGHEWTFKEMAKWSGEPDIYTCTRCNQDLRVERDSSPEDSAKQQRIVPCDEHLLKSVMST